MAEPFLSEIRIFSFAFAPKGWAMCNGQSLPINQNQALFSLLGTTYGGDGQGNFGLPDLRGRTPIHVGGGHTLGERGGAQNHTLIPSELPAHTHLVGAVSSAANNASPVARAPAMTVQNIYSDAVPNVAMQQTLTNTGGGQAHLNMQPFLVVNACIALQGIFPSPT
jgi:microcystin-dependent protein